MFQGNDEVGDADGPDAEEGACNSPNDPSHSGIPLINDIDSSQILVEYVDTNTDIEVCRLVLYVLSKWFFLKGMHFVLISSLLK